MHSNQLVHEKSPYLLQHAHNPVDWHVWGEETFRKARAEDKPIFLSIGYSTCHWCHVMERESFQSEETAQVLNRHFVPVKVDREERPDIDRIYMTFVQATTGSGGWPLSVWMTPDLEPFFGGTYFPPDGQHGRPGFRELLERIREAWQLDRASILESSAQVVEHLRRAAEVTPGRAGLDDSILHSGFNVFRRNFDPQHGGFGGAPKFPRPAVYDFLLRYWQRTGNREAREMVFATLKAMARGGMHDHLGGGFHRYSVDERWLTPHFEKMLYDQAQLASSYLEAFQISAEEFYAGVARQILDYVLRDMTDRAGGFYSAEDADSTIDPSAPEVKEEGAFYVWTQGEIEQALGQPAAERFCHYYALEERGILHEARTPPEEVRASLADSRQKLFQQRSRRPRPHLDDKVLTAWNGLMISAFAKGARVLEDARYLAAARRAAGFLRDQVWKQKEAGLLLRRYRDGEAAIPGFLDDYAFFAQGLLDLYEADFDLRDLELAVELTEKQLELFEDPQDGAFFSAPASANDLLLRMKDNYDGAEPSGNSVAILNLLRLARITAREDFRDSAERALQAFAEHLAAAPETSPQMLAALAYSRSRPQQIVLVGPKQDHHMRELLRALNRRFLPDTTVLLVDDEPSRRTLAVFAPAVEAMSQIDGKPTAYVCENYACRLPTNDAGELIDSLSH